MGQPIVRIDPYGVCGPGGDSINILDQVGAGLNASISSRAIIAAIVVRPPDGEKEAHWNDQAENLIVGALGFGGDWAAGQG